MSRVDTTVPPAPLCLSCGQPCCLCLVRPGHHCTSMLECGRHVFDPEELEVWKAEIVYRMQLWRRRHGARALVEATTYAVRFTGPNLLAVEIGPVLPYDVRVKLAEAIEACPLCGDDDLCAAWDDHVSVSWILCPLAESEPDAGHLEIIGQTLD